MRTDTINIVMLGANLKQNGGIATVEKLILQGLPSEFSVRHITSHDEGTVLYQVVVFVQSVNLLSWQLLTAKPDLVHIHVSDGGSIIQKTILTLIANSFGKDLTLSGRTILWAAVWEMIQRQPWLGYGYAGFWQGMNGESAYVWLATGWKMNHPHNGFLGVLLDLGFVGLFLFLVSFIQNLYRSLLLLRFTDTATAFYPILSLFFLFISNLTETSLPFTSDLGCALYVFLSLVLVRELKEVRISKLELEIFELDYSSSLWSRFKLSVGRIFPRCYCRFLEDV